MPDLDLQSRPWSRPSGVLAFCVWRVIVFLSLLVFMNLSCSTMWLKRRFHLWIPRGS